MDEILVTENAAIVSPAVTNNSRSMFAVIWGAENGAKLVGALFDLRGNPVSGEFEVSTSTGSICSSPVAAHMAGPAAGFAVAWIGGSPQRVTLRRFDREAKPLGAPVELGNGIPLPGFGPALARGFDGSSIVCWVGEDTAVHAVSFDPTGNPRGPDFVVSPPGFHTGPVRVVGLQNDNFAVCWISGEGNLMLQVLTTAGSKVGNARTLDLSRLGGNFSMAPIVIASPTAGPGHFAVAHIATAFPAGPGGGQRVVVGTVFGPTGDRLHGGSFNITQRQRNTVAGNLAMTPLPNQHFLVTWSERPIPEQDQHRTGDDIKAMLCHEERGVLPGSGSNGIIPAIDVNTSRQGNQVLPAAAVAIDAETGDPASAIVWLDDNTGSPDSARRTVKLRVLSSAQMPSA